MLTAERVERGLSLLSIPGPIVGVTILKRLNKFAVEVASSNGDTFSCHLHDPGRLVELVRPGAEAAVKFVGRVLNRKTLCDLVAVRSSEGVWVLADSRPPNKLFERAVELGHIFKDYKVVRSEYRVEKKRLDFLLQKESGEQLFVEVKGCNLVVGGIALFPDAPTKRGREHVLLLKQLKLQNLNAAIVFVIVRSDAHLLKPHKDMDPGFAAALCEAWRSGVEVRAFKVSVDVRPDSVRASYGGEVPVDPCTDSASS